MSSTERMSVTYSSVDIGRRDKWVMRVMEEWCWKRGGGEGEGGTV